jgi:hypothetical protein
MDDYYMETASHQQYDYEAERRQEKWEFRTEMKAEEDIEAMYMVEQERNLNHAQDNA